MRYVTVLGIHDGHDAGAAIVRNGIVISAVQEERLVNIKHYSDFVYVYTPKGEIIKLPRGSNIIDFAYALHRDLGNSCIGGTVNGEFKPLTYELQNGDRVEVKTQKGKKLPSSDWIKLAKTKKAISGIRKVLRK